MTTPAAIDQRRCRLRAALALALAAAGLPAAAAPGPAPQRRPWPAGRATPKLELPGVGETSWSLAAARGRVVLLNFWASWCEPCTEELPSLERLAQHHAGDGLLVRAVNHRESDAAIGRFLGRQPTTLAILRDRDGMAARAWGVNLFPTTVAIGRDGRAAFSVIGDADWSGEPARAWVAALL